MKKVYLVALVLLVFRSYSQTHVVTNLSNSGTGSLRDKVASASAGDTITFSPSLFTNGSDTLKLNQPIIFTKGPSLQGWMNGGDTLVFKRTDCDPDLYLGLGLGQCEL
ncbi:MAG: hypothetical protein LPK46_08995 [Bacteroidota bacterium]|nr:hypothetical protein [Bacteroidota bacterium]MDX5506258.1 hypothetical protein [Bacteroidota bacterium]